MPQKVVGTFGAAPSERRQKVVGTFGAAAKWLAPSERRQKVVGTFGAAPSGRRQKVVDTLWVVGWVGAMIGLYFALAFGITWLVQLPAVLAHCGMIPGPEQQYMNPAGFGLFGPMIAALVVTRIEGGRGAARAFWRSVWQWRVHPVWYVAALALPAVGYVVVRGVYGLFSPDAGPWLFPPADPQRVAAMIIAPIGEEIGWRGFALPRLQQRYSRLAAAVVLGAFWGLWHIMMYLMVGLPGQILIISVIFLIPGSVLFSWIYNRSDGSAFVAILAHAGVHLNNPNQALPGNPMPFYLNVVVYTLLGVAVLADRGAWRKPAATKAVQI